MIWEEGSGQMKQPHVQVLGGASKEAGAASAQGKEEQEPRLGGRCAGLCRSYRSRGREGGVQGFAGGTGAEVREGGVQGFAGGTGATGGFGAEE